MTDCDALLGGVLAALAHDARVKPMSDGCAIVLPLETTSGHAIEIRATNFGSHHVVLSDRGRTISELIALGCDPDVPSRVDRLTGLLGRFGISRSEGELLLLVETGDLPRRVLDFAMALKSIADLSLLHRVSRHAPYHLNLAIRSVLAQMDLQFAEGRDAQVQGTVEVHRLDFLGWTKLQRQFAVGVVGGATRQSAEAWAFRFSDMAGASPNLLRIAVYDDDDEWKDRNLRILMSAPDVTIPGSEVQSQLRDRLAAA